MDAIGRLRAALTDAGYDAAGLAGALQREPGRSSMPHELPLAARRAELAPAPLRTAIRLFVLEQAVAADEVERLLPPVRADDLVALGLAADDGAFLRPRVRLAAHERFLLASDPTAGMHGSDYVPGVTRPSWLLSHLTVRRPVARALEIGTGNGMLALIASTHAEHVVATDVNEHALELAELNLRLNDVRNVELRAGSFFEPVEGERFDLVFSNPPYVISPETSYLFRDGGLGRDRVSEHMATGLPAVLADDGYATVTISWIGEPERPLSWLEASGCDAWLLHTTSEDALATAAAWNRDIQDDPAAYGEALDRWVEWFRAEQIESVAYGALILHRREGDNWQRSMHLPAATLQPASEHVLRLFAAHGELADEDVVVAAPDARLGHTLKAGERGWRVVASQLALTGGLGSTAALDGPGTAVLQALDGRPLGEAFAAARANKTDVDAETFDAGARAFVRRLLELGFLVRAG